MKKKMIKSLYNLICLFIFFIVKFTSSQSPESPCPKIFQYKFDGEIWYGEINIVILPDSNQALMELQCSLSKLIEKNHNGSLQFISDIDDVINCIDNKAPLSLSYKYIFPDQDVLPVVEFIKLNGLLYCLGTEDPESRVSLTFYNNIHWKTEQTAPVEIDSDEPVDNRQQLNFRQSVLDSSEPQQRKNVPFAKPRPLPLPNMIQHDSRFPVLPPKSIPTSYQQNTNEICGINPPKVLQLIVNGDSSETQPWLVSLFEGIGSNVVYFCAGSLISHRHVITAAHCVQNKAVIYVSLGKMSLTSEVTPYQRVRLKQTLYIHPNYVPETNYANVAIIELNDPVEFTDKIRPICLWSYEVDVNKIVGRIGTIVGWGINENGTPEAKNPKKADVRVVREDLCKENYGFRRDIFENTICAQGAKHPAGPCLGDSGGPMIMYVNKRWTLRGIISATVKPSNSKTCDVENYYSLYVDVAKYLNWIYFVLNKN